jgi:hypothetical protein
MRERREGDKGTKGIKDIRMRVRDEDKKEVIPH